MCKDHIMNPHLWHIKSRFGPAYVKNCPFSVLCCSWLKKNNIYLLYQEYKVIQLAIQLNTLVGRVIYVATSLTFLIKNQEIYLKQNNINFFVNKYKINT